MERNSLFVGNNLITAADARVGMSGLVVPGNASTKARTGIFPGPGNPGQVAATGSGGNVTVQPFKGAIQTANAAGLGGAYFVTLDEVKTVNLFAEALFGSGNTIYEIIARQYNNTDYGEGTADEFKVMSVRGPSSGVAPTLTGDYIWLATATVPAGTANLTGGMVVNKTGTNKQWIVASGAPIPVQSATEETAVQAYAWPGLKILRLDRTPIEEKIWNGSAWRIISTMDEQANSSTSPITGLTNTSYVQPAGSITTTVNVPTSGKLRVDYGARMFASVNGTSIFTGVSLSGANTFNHTGTTYDSDCIGSSLGGAVTAQAYSKVFTGLNPGATTCYLVSKQAGSGNHAWYNHWIAARGIA